MPAQPAKNHPLSVVLSAAPESDSHSGAARRDSPSVCASCYGTGMEVVPGKGARRWRCRTEERRAELSAAARIPRRYERCSFANYHPVSDNGTQLQAFKYAFKLVKEYPAVERGLLLLGSCG